MSYGMVFYMFNDLKREVIVQFVDICGIVEQSLCFFFIIMINCFVLLLITKMASYYLSVVKRSNLVIYLLIIYKVQ
jgi:hypothetical protein